MKRWGGANISTLVIHVNDFITRLFDGVFILLCHQGIGAVDSLGKGRNPFYEYHCFKSIDTVINQGE